MNICDEDCCLLCFVPRSCCDCELSDFAWSRSTSQDSSSPFADHGNPENFAVNVPAIVGKCLPWSAFEKKNQGLEMGDMIRSPGRVRSRQPCAGSTPKDDVDCTGRRESPGGAMPPPDSSSPAGLGTDWSPFWTDPTLPTSPREDVIERPLLFRRQHETPYNDRIATSTDRFPPPPHWQTPDFQIQQVPSAETDMGASLQVKGRRADWSVCSSSVPGCSAARWPLDKRVGAFDDRQVVAEDVLVNVQGICTPTTRTVSERSNEAEKRNEIDPESPMPASRKGASLSVPTILDLAISTEPGSPSSHGAEDDRQNDTTTTSGETDGNVYFKMPPRRASVNSVSCLAQPVSDGHLKRRRSSVERPPDPSKKAKLDRAVSQVSRANDLSNEFKYQATEPASIRRAQSLRSELSASSEEPTDSIFYPSPLSPSASRSCTDQDYVPTAPNTPLPDSVDYTRSKANPLVRTIAVRRHRSSSIPVMPPVPVIAPPAYMPPSVVHCTEDRAINRLHVLLHRERSERKRDGLCVQDTKRTERLRSTCVTDSALSRRDSMSTSGSSDDRCQWEEESTRSEIDSEEIKDPAPTVKIFPGERRLVNQETWSNAFGIANDLRKEVTGWILQKLPKEPVPSVKPSRDTRRFGIDLYDQLTSSRQTRFHAAQLFHRYFLLPEKVQFWKEALDHERFKRESCLRNDSEWERGVWDLAVACMGLSVKLHRDCLPPLGPVYAIEFLEMAPYSMTHETFELAQRDIMYTFQFLLASCTPQDVLDELWNALPTLRKTTTSIRDGWMVVQSVTWDKLFESLLEPDVLQYPVTLLTAAALVDGLIFALAGYYKAEAEADVCKCKAAISEGAPDDRERTSWQIHLFEATQLVGDVILDVRDVLQLSEMELDECRAWLDNVGQE